MAVATAFALLAALLGSATSPSAADGGVTSRGERHPTDVVYRHTRIHVSSSFFGIHDGSMAAYGRVPFGSVRLWDAGVTWSYLETSPGTYDWSRLDSLVSAAQAHHVKVTLVLAMTPPFYATSRTLPPTDPDAYARFVRAVMTRYRTFNGRRGIESYQVWNEGNISTFWTGTPQQLAQLTEIVDHVRDEVDPRATVVAPSFAVTMPYQRRWMTDYQSQVVDGHPVWQHYDVNALSLYPEPRTGERAAGPEDAMALLHRSQNRLASAGVPHRKQLWISEVNYGLRGGPDGPQPAYHLAQRRQVANVLRTYLLAAANGVSRVFWYRYDWHRLLGGGTLGNTLLSDPNDSARVWAPGRALRLAQHWLRGHLLSTNGRRPCARMRSGTYQCTIIYRRVVHNIYWNPHRKVRIQLPGARVRSRSRAGRRVAVRTVKVGFRPLIVRVRH
jgi:polysaccharide biosynthesis protein PslG